MISREQSLTTITMLRLPEPPTEQEVLNACGFRGIDPDPVILLVLRRAPRQRFEYRPGPDGCLHPHVERENVYTNALWDWVCIDTPEMEHAVALLNEVRPIRIQTIRL